MKKYKLLENDTINYYGKTLYRIQAVRDFGNVKKGDLGGYIESERNLSHDGECWVDGNAKVCDYAKVCGKAEVDGDAIVRGCAVVDGYAVVDGDAVVSSSEDYIVFKNNWSSGRYFTYTFSNNMWCVGCFYGTGEELIEKAYKDSKLSGDMYKMYAELVEKMKEYRAKGEYQ